MNPIGNAYIIMEKMGGLELVDRWHEIQNGPVAGVFQGSAGSRKRVRVCSAFIDGESVFQEGCEFRNALTASVP